jgi:hypothetical protein
LRRRAVSPRVSREEFDQGVHVETGSERPVSPRLDPSNPWKDDPFPTAPDAACSFCGRTRAETGPLAGGPSDGLHVCFRCADVMRLMFAQWKQEGRFTAAQLPLPDPPAQ